MAPPDVEGMIFQDGAYFVPVEGGYARLPSPLDQLVTPTTPDLESSVAGLGAKTQEFLAAGDKERARESLRTARRLVHGNEAMGMHGAEALARHLRTADSNVKLRDQPREMRLRSKVALDSCIKATLSLA